MGSACCGTAGLQLLVPEDSVKLELESKAPAGERACPLAVASLGSVLVPFLTLGERSEIQTT
jgi:hypothetical protein